MANVFDVAAYILRALGTMSAMKLQKLVYYSQAWALTWDDQPLFNEEIQAWANGPVCVPLYYAHQGQFKVSEMPKGRPEILTQDELETIDTVLAYYGPKEPHQLSELTHMEQPWIAARGNTPAGERCAEVITHASMAEYYGGL